MISVAKHSLTHSKLSKFNKLIYENNSNIISVGKGRDTWFVYIDGHKVGYVQIENKDCLAKLENFGVVKELRRAGLMSFAFKVILPYYSGKVLACMVPDDNLAAHQFLKKHEFVCVKSPERDKYMFQRRKVKQNQELELIA